MALQLEPDSPLAEYEARILATSMNLRRYGNEMLGLIRAAQEGDMPEEDAFKALEELDGQWATILVDDLAPRKHLLS